MDPLTYKVLHLGGLIGLFTCLGALAAAKGSLKPAAIGMGVSLLVILVAGFGMMAKLRFGFQGWIIAKIILWVLLGCSLSVFKRNLLPRPAAVALVVVLGIAAAYLGVMKSFG
jgi:hypothetical protein